MECTEQSWLSNEQYLRTLARKAAAERVPVAGSMAITHRCNLRCVHCFLGDEAGHERVTRRELTITQIRDILDQVVAAGCLTMLLTGGEPLLRPDFGEIYRYARQLGLLVTVFTNGTLVSERDIGLFAEMPPRAVELTMYGATAATYERITGVAGSFARFLCGFEKLLRAGVHVRLKTMLMTWNAHELRDMQSFARDNGVVFRFDAGISPRLNGDHAPLRFRVAAGEAIAFEFSDAERIRGWRDYVAKRNIPPVKDTLYECGAWMIGFHIDANGWLLPCQMAGRYGYDLVAGTFAEGWQQAMPAIRQQKADETLKCRACEKRLLCASCPACSALETGSETVPSEYICELGGLRYERVFNAPETGGYDE
jgi:radical SAM protein with 4Fe4S-binding SPASM domain